jgi:hypothetical protein
MLPEAESDLPGLRNSGLLATQELRNGVPARPDWARATAKGKPLLGLAGRSLIEGLGFAVTSLSVNSSVLTVGAGIKRAVAIFLDEGETFDDAAQRFQGTSPVSHAIAQADKEGLSWVILTRSRQIRLYAARPDTGVGRKGRAETFVEANLALLPEDKAGYLPLLFGADALIEGGTIEDILERSADFAAELAARLRDRVYFDTVPQLATAVAARLGDTSKLTDYDLSHAYEQTLIILFRLLFVAYAEDKDLLPYRSNSKYADHSLKHMARRLAEDRRAGKEDFDDAACALWVDVCELWQAVDRGNRGWGVPSYNGGLFSNEVEVNVAGAALARIKLTDAEFGKALTAMLVDEGPDGVIGPVDFRSLSVREFGTIYEGLLESMLSVAPGDLSTDARGNYVPAKKSDEVLVKAGHVYFHNRSGSRKATGSYFTKPFAVEHLLDHALEPALDDHLARVQRLLDGGDEAAAADAFFDFRCADIAMGSGHFLVAAVDRIEARLSNFLALHPVPAINAELDTLHRAALDALADLADGVEIETTSLLRRQVARRCIYGVDLNHISVELARLSIWIHTFVPGLPLSFLDHSLVCGNSLTGIGTLDEALEVLDPDHGQSGQVSLFRADIEAFLERASGALQRLGHITETSTADIAEARTVHKEALAAVEPARQLFDLLVAVRLGEAPCPVSIDEGSIAKAPGAARGEDLAVELQALHFPTAFPEVFARERPGFDCILGNPPWEKVKVEEHIFWGLRFPGLRSMPIGEQNREVKHLQSARPDLLQEYEEELVATEAMRAVLHASYPLGSGDPDLYKAFCWRFWALVREGGSIGVVLPRSALSAAGSSAWRLAVLAEGTFADVTMTTNTGGWVFDDAEHRYTIGFVSIRRIGPTPSAVISLRGPFADLRSYRAGVTEHAVEFDVDEFTSWTTGASFPLIPGRRAGEVFLRLRAHPRLDTPDRPWRARPVLGDLHATQGKGHMLLAPDSTSGLWPVFTGGSFNIWEADLGPQSYYAWIEPKTARRVLQEKRMSSAGRSGSVWAGFPADHVSNPDTLPCYRPRIAFRDVARATDTRTVIVSLIPGHVVVSHQAPYLLWPRGDERDQAYLLGVLSSIPLDWYARRFVETHVTFDPFNAFPVPSIDRDDPRRREVELAAGRLAACGLPFAEWANDVGVDWGPLAQPERQSLIARLDAAVAHLYGLQEDDLKLIFETFHVGWDYTSRLSAVLDHYRDLA